MTEAKLCHGRRALLAGAGGLGVAGVLAACGSPTADAAADPTAGAQTPSATGAPQQEAQGSAALATTSQVPVGGGVVTGGVLIVQPTEGDFKAFDAACPHQGAVVGTPQGGVITCRVHNSTFKDTDGSRISGPATKGLTPVAVKVDGANIVRS